MAKPVWVCPRPASVRMPFPTPRLQPRNGSRIRLYAAARYRTSYSGIQTCRCSCRSHSGKSFPQCRRRRLRLHAHCFVDILERPLEAHIKSVLELAPMGMSLKIKRFAAWIACLAILLAALAPPISHAIAAKKPSVAAGHEICTADGLQSVEKIAPESIQDHQDFPENAMHMEHCPFCLTSAASFALLPASFRLPVMSGSPILPSLFYESSRPLFAWLTAQPRGPPFQS